MRNECNHGSDLAACIVQHILRLFGLAGCVPLWQRAACSAVFGVQALNSASVLQYIGCAGKKEGTEGYLFKQIFVNSMGPAAWMLEQGQLPLLLHWLLCQNPAITTRKLQLTTTGDHDQTPPAACVLSPC